MSNTKDSNKPQEIFNGEELELIHSKNTNIQNKYEEGEDAKELEYMERTRNKRNRKRPQEN